MNTKQATSVEDLALDLGARVLYPDGKVFNAAGRSGVSRLPAPRAVAHDTAPAPPVSNVEQVLQKLTELLAQKTAPMEAPPAARMPDIVIPPAAAPTIVVQKAAPCSWSFDFERNKDGTLKRVVANPIQP